MSVRYIMIIDILKVLEILEFVILYDHGYCILIDIV